MANTQTTTTAPATPAASQPGLMGSLAPILLMLLVFYLLIMHPQQKRDAKRRELVNSAKKGDRVLLSSGIIGTLHKVIGEKEVSIEIAENVRIRVLRNSIVEILDKNASAVDEEPRAATSAGSTSVPSIAFPKSGTKKSSKK